MKGQIVLLSHGNLCQGMKDTVEMIIGKQERLHALSLYSDSGISEFSEKLDEFVKKNADSEIIFVTDLFGGSVNNTVVERYVDLPKVKILTGMNLPLVIELIMGEEMEEQNIEQAIMVGQKNIMKMNGIVLMNDGDE